MTGAERALADSTPARRLWTCIETIHAVTYFAEESRDAAKRVGLKGFWMGYFGFRAAPLGAVSAGTVDATFANFAPEMVRRSVPDVWRFAEPDALVAARSSAAAKALRRIVPVIEQVADDVIAPLELLVDTAHPLGRPLFGANRDLEPDDDPVARLWQLCTTLREHRGDGHVTVLAAHGVDGCEAHHLVVAADGIDASVLRDNRGWSDTDWDRAGERLRARGLIVAGALTDAGRALRLAIETMTDELAVDPPDHALLDALTPLAAGVAASGVIPYPNPMGLPRISP